MKTAIDILEMFTSPYSSREWMNRPFSLDGHTGATDGQCLILMKEKVKAAHISGETEAYVWGVIPKEKFEIKISLKELKEAIKKVPMIDELEYEDIECQCCDEEGEVEFAFSHGGREYHHDYECPICDGSGFELEAKEVPTGNMIMDPDCKIQFGPCEINHRFVARLVAVAEYEELDSVSLVSDIRHAGSPCLFKVGKTKVLVMPVLCGDNSFVIHHFEFSSIKNDNGRS